MKICKLGDSENGERLNVGTEMLLNAGSGFGDHRRCGAIALHEKLVAQDRKVLGKEPGRQTIQTTQTKSSPVLAGQISQSKPVKSDLAAPGPKFDLSVSKEGGGMVETTALRKLLRFGRKGFTGNLCPKGQNGCLGPGKAATEKDTFQASHSPKKAVRLNLRYSGSQNENLSHPRIPQGLAPRRWRGFWRRWPQ